jgi:hypothetical protein
MKLGCLVTQVKVLGEIREEFTFEYLLALKVEIEGIRAIGDDFFVQFALGVVAFW